MRKFGMNAKELELKVWLKRALVQTMSMWVDSGCDVASVLRKFGCRKEVLKAYDSTRLNSQRLTCRRH